MNVKTDIEAQRPTVIAEIQRLAAKNNGICVGEKRFRKETSISQYTVRLLGGYNRLRTEAGYPAGQVNKGIDDEQFLIAVATEIRRSGHFPTFSEQSNLSGANRTDGNWFPSPGAFRSRGGKPEVIRSLVAYCEQHPEFGDVHAILIPLAGVDEEEAGSGSSSPAKDGWVYLMREPHGKPRRYKIGKTLSPDRRITELNTGRGYALVEVHWIQTDGPRGVEGYWHNQFKHRNVRGEGIGDEWFELSREEVRMIKRWKKI